MLLIPPCLPVYCGLVIPEIIGFPAWASKQEGCGSAQFRAQDSKPEDWQPLSDYQKHLAKTQALLPPIGILPFLRLSLNVEMAGKSKLLIQFTVLFINATEKSSLGEKVAAL